MNLQGLVMRSEECSLKKFSFLLFFLLFVFTGCSEEKKDPNTAAAPLPEAIPDENALIVDWLDVKQSIVGFGGTMGWIHPHPDRREEIFDLLFKKLGVSVLRIRALGGEEPVANYSVTVNQ